MTIKEYLNRARYLDREIDAKLDHQARLNSIIYKATSTLSDMPGSPSRDVARREKAIAKVIDLEKEIDEQIDELVDTKREINKLIEKIPTKEHKLLLEFRYVNLFTWEKISEQMDITLRHVYRLHGAALLEADKVWRTSE